MKNNDSAGCLPFLFVFMIIVMFIIFNILPTKNINISGRIIEKTISATYYFPSFNASLYYNLYIEDNSEKVQQIIVKKEDYFSLNIEEKINLKCLVGGFNEVYLEKCIIE